MTARRDPLAGGRETGRSPDPETKGRPVIGSYRVEQRQFAYRGRWFHFVSYDGRPADPARGYPGALPAWFLMNAGTRWEVAPQVAGEEPADTDRRLLDWLERTLAEPPDGPSSTTRRSDQVGPGTRRASASPGLPGSSR